MLHLTCDAFFSEGDDGGEGGEAEGGEGGEGEGGEAGEGERAEEEKKDEEEEGQEGWKTATFSLSQFSPIFSESSSPVYPSLVSVIYDRFMIGRWCGKGGQAQHVFRWLDRVGDLFLVWSRFQESSVKNLSSLLGRSCSFCGDIQRPCLMADEMHLG